MPIVVPDAQRPGSRTSAIPSVPSIMSKAASSCSRRETSAAAKSSRPPGSATGVASGAGRSQTATRGPAPARRRPIAAPRPVRPPVTTAILPSRHASGQQATFQRSPSRVAVGCPARPAAGRSSRLREERPHRIEVVVPPALLVPALALRAVRVAEREQGAIGTLLGTAVH